MTSAWSVRALREASSSDLIELARVLIDCVEGDASVSFMHPLEPEAAIGFWTEVAQSVCTGERALWVAEDALGLCGTVQLVFAQQPNQPHRADLSKLLVHRRARRNGVGSALVRAAEEGAIAAGRSLLVLDTASIEAERLYARQGWQRVGVIPNFALLPRGGYCDTTVFFRDLSPRLPSQSSRVPSALGEVSALAATRSSADD